MAGSSPTLCHSGKSGRHTTTASGRSRRPSITLRLLLRCRVGVDPNAAGSERPDYTAAVEWWEDDEHNLYLAGAWRERLSEGHRAWLTRRTESTEANAPAEFGRPQGPPLSWPEMLLPEGFAGLAGTPQCWSLRARILTNHLLPALMLVAAPTEEPGTPKGRRRQLVASCRTRSWPGQSIATGTPRRSPRDPPAARLGSSLPPPYVGPG